jgi:hypothetical protein
LGAHISNACSVAACVRRVRETETRDQLLAAKNAPRQRVVAMRARAFHSTVLASRRRKR